MSSFRKENINSSFVTVLVYVEFHTSQHTNSLGDSHNLSISENPYLANEYCAFCTNVYCLISEQAAVFTTIESPLYMKIMLRNHFVLVIFDNSIRKRVLTKQKLTFEKAIERATIAEQVSIK